MLETNPQPPLQIYRKMHKQMINQQESHAILLDLKVIQNPVLQNDENYNKLCNLIKLYNKKVQNIDKQPLDSYETQCYNGLYRILGEINAMTNKDIQIERLKATREWFEQQEKTVGNRMAQGVIRYKTLRRRSLQNSPQKYQEIKTQRLDIPSQILATTMLPYYKKWRSAHQEHGIPIERVTQYKRKILNIQPIIDQKTMPVLRTQRWSTRMTFPRPIKPVVEEQQKQQDKIDEENKDAPPIDPNAPPGESGAQPAEQAQQRQELMLGEQPEQPQQPDEPEQTGQDKLAPKNKIYIDSISAPITSRIPNDIEAKGTFKFAEPDSSKAERAMELRFKNIQNKTLEQIREDQEKLQKMDIWSKGKSRMTKELQKRLQFISLKPNYVYSEEEKRQPYNLSEEEEIKFNFITKEPKNKSKNVDLSLQLPRLNSQYQGYQKTVQKSRLRDLKKRFSHVLNLTTDIEERQVPKSLCQYSTRFKSFSAVLQQHSSEKQRLIQMDEANSIKDKLTKNKLGVNITTLVHGLCLPIYAQKQENIGFPTSNLPSNPHMVQKKKKKKK